MKFKDLLNILHVRAYVGKQDVFLIDLLKGSVSEPDKIDIAPSTLKGYFQGNRITELAATLKDAGFSPKKLTSYIEGLYELPHKDSKTYDRYGDKLYKDVLYENAKEKYSDISFENMASYLAERFQEFISEAIPTVNITDIKEVTVSETIQEIEIDDVKTFIKELQKAIHNLQDIGHQIASRVSKMKAAEDYKLPEYFLPAEVKSAIHRELINRTGLYPELESRYNKLQKLYDSIDQYNIEHNEKILTEALKLIANIKIDDFIEKWREAAIKSRNNQYIIELNSLIQNYFEGNSK